MPLRPGSTLGPYEILAPLGAGGMGEVYRAHDSRLGRDVALKVIADEAARDPGRIRRFHRETRAAGALNHPNVCAVFDLGTYLDSPFVVMELLEGETLRARLEAGPVPVRKAIDYAVQTAHGLTAAHAKGIVHRDLKPENLFVTKDGLVKVLDFGLAYRSAHIPLRVERIDTATGARTTLLETAPAEPSGLLSFPSISVADDLGSYAYCYIRAISTLYQVERRR